MKKIALLIVFLFTFSLAPFNLAYAISMPKINFVPKVVDAATYTIKGKTEPFARVSAIGGEHQIPPVSADESGNFEITVGLAQETLNQFSISASKDGDVSSAAVVTIRESHEEAKAYQEETKLDVVAPDAPVVDDHPSPVNADIIKITGSGESEAIIRVTKSDGSILKEQQIEKTGEFSVCLPVEQNKNNYYSFLVEDPAENTSIIVQIKIEESDDADEIIPEGCAVPKKEEEEKKDEKKILVTVADPFIDIEGHWSEEFIETLRLKGIVSGKQPKIFEPNAFVTRAELLKIALRAFDYSISETVTAKPFSDVEESDWHAAYLAKAKSLNAIKGYAGNKFKPNQSISRAEALKIFLALSGLEIEEGIGNNFDDLSANDWFYTYVSYAAKHDIVGGYSDGTFLPNNPITRAGVAKIAVKLMNQVAENKKMNEKNNDAKPAANDKDEEGDDDEELQTYTNDTFSFRFQYNKNWYYHWVGAEDGESDLLATIRLSKKNPMEDDLTETDILVQVHLKKGSLEDMDKTDGDEELTEMGKVVYKTYEGEDRHFEIEILDGEEEGGGGIVDTLVINEEE